MSYEIMLGYLLFFLFLFLPFSACTVSFGDTECLMTRQSEETSKPSP